MSLFKARDWWSTALGEKEEFDQGCLCVADVDNSGSGQDKIIVGSYMGYLRIFNPHPVKPGDGMQAEDLLLEVQLRDSILQVEVGKFVSGTELLHLAVLHCRKLCVYAVSGTLGNVEHGNQYQIKLTYEHNLQRTACNMTYGPFGGVKGRDLICIQSMDGMLMLFEQESYAFGRFLPGFLLPGPITYSSRTDSFITVSSCQQVESYKYQVLAFATDADEREETEQQKLSSGKRLVMDWVLNIGEQALDICIVSFNQTSSVFVLGERNFFCLKDNGQIRFMKKLDCSPSCFLPYCSVSEGTINTLVGNHNNMLHVYQDVTLKWATQLPHIPVAVKVGNLQDLKGVIVTLSDGGHLQCSYLGTDPSLFQAPKVESREINYEELDREMKELQKIIKESTKTQDILPKSEKYYDDLRITAEVSPDLDVASQAIDSEVRAEAVPSVTVKITLQSRLAVQKTKLSICVQPPLALTHDQFLFDDIESCGSKAVALSVFLKGNCPPAELEGNAVASYSMPTDFADQSDEDQVNVLGFQFLTGSRITLLASKTSQRYRIQSEQLEDLWLITKELTFRLEEHFKKQNSKDFTCIFSGSVPLQEYFELIDHHFELRLNAEKFEELLSERAIQFRAIERRLLTRFKDKTPAPLQHLDTLLEGTYRQIIALADAAEENQINMFQAFTKLKSATQLVIMLISLWQKLSTDQVAILEATFLPLMQDTQELGWEESVDAAISHLLRTCLSKSSKEQALTLTSQLNIPKDTSRLKKHITLLCDRLAKGGRLCLSTDTNIQQTMVMPGGCTPIQESDLEERTGIQDSTTMFTNHRHLTKQKSKTESCFMTTRSSCFGQSQSIFKVVGQNQMTAWMLCAWTDLSDVLWSLLFFFLFFSFFFFR
ncbi:protein PTHB1 isoform X9 [Dermochelys coriacea]|uniref:protein PTHB1 isoform X9 n=1 Tax=Dermochelys coriacea TaxID=27794 RepID=UPI001CA9C335|nr:protein PTHB1 isoform X9 [Dermochelys coriacea]